MTQKEKQKKADALEKQIRLINKGQILLVQKNNSTYTYRLNRVEDSTSIIL